jgi:hypothetical protein
MQTSQASKFQSSLQAMRSLSNLAVAGFIAATTSYVHVPASLASDRCTQGLTRTRQEISSRYGAHVEKVENLIAEDPASPYANRPREVLITIGSLYISPAKKKSSVQFMENRKAQTYYANQIVANCSDVARVVYAQNNTGWFVGYSLIKNKIVRNTCISHQGLHTPKPKWGQEVCG